VKRRLNPIERRSPRAPSTDCLKQLTKNLIHPRLVDDAVGFVGAVRRFIKFVDLVLG